MARFPLYIAVLAALLFASSAMSVAQVATVQGDFFNITRTIEQTADSTAFTVDTLVLRDNGAGLGNFQTNDSITIMFVQNRFRIVNDMLPGGTFDYIHARVRYDNGMTLGRPEYNGVAVGMKNGAPILGSDKEAGSGQTGLREIGLRPVYRPAGAIAASSAFNSNPESVRQVLTFQVFSPVPDPDAIQLWNIRFKPDINNLTGLASPPDTTKDTLRAYHLDGTEISAGDVMSYTDLAIVRLMPGTTRILMWVKDSAQSVDAGEYIGSFGDYSRGRYFAGDDGLVTSECRTMHFRPGEKSYAWGPGKGNPDYGMPIDGFPPEESAFRASNLFQVLAPFWYNKEFPAIYPERPELPCSNPNPENGLIPPYRIGEYAVAADPYQPGLVSSAADTLRFLDAWGNRTWDRNTAPQLTALAYEGDIPLDRTEFLTGYAGEGDMLRQTGQVVFRRLAYMHSSAGAERIRIGAHALVRFTDPTGNPAILNALPDTSGGFPRMWEGGITIREPYTEPDNGRRVPMTWVIESDLTPPNPLKTQGKPPMMDSHAISPTGVKIAVWPNLPRKVEIVPDFESEGQALKLAFAVKDGFGNAVDDNERFFCELSPFAPWNPRYRTAASIDSIPGTPLDSGRVSLENGTAVRYLVAPEGPEAVGAYRLRVRASYSFPDRNGPQIALPYPLRLDPFPTGNPRSIDGFSHANIIPEGSPNIFGTLFEANALKKCTSPRIIDAGFGKKMGQATAIDSIDLYWDGDEWSLCEECRDFTPPRLTVTLEPSALDISDGSFVEVDADVECEDDRGDCTWKLFSITGGESPADIREAEIGTDDDSFELRAERGSVYTVTFEAKDAAGNTTVVKKRISVKW